MVVLPKFIVPSKEEIKELCLMVQQNKIQKFFFEFITADQDIINYVLDQIPKSPNLVQLYLRGNKIDDDQVKILFDAMEANVLTTNLKFLELTFNQLSKKGLRSVTNYFRKQNKIEYLGLAKNSITQWDDLKELFDLLIKKKLSPEELQAYRDQEAQREAQIKLQQKQKGKKGQEEIQLIVLEPIAQNQDGSFSIIQNQYFKVLNLAMNQIGDQDKDNLDKFLGQVQDQFQLVMVNNSFDPKIKEKLKKKFKNLLI